MQRSGADDSQLEVSIIAPAHNEHESVAPLVHEVIAVMDPLGIAYEIIIVDDGSTDGTSALLGDLIAQQPRLRCIRMQGTPPGAGSGQSAAFHAGFHAARAPLIATLDADGQNDPADIPALLDAMRRHDADLVQGNRRAARADGRLRSFSSWVGRFFRSVLLGDTNIDTGCSLRIMRREVALKLPLEYRGMHRFIPITARQLGYRVIEVPVSHRPRRAGKGKYGMWDRALPGLIDCFAVRWMRSRRRPTEYAEVARFEKSSGAAQETSEREVVTR